MSAFWSGCPLSVDRRGRRVASRSKRARRTSFATIEVQALEARRLLSGLTISLESTSDTGLSNSDRITQDNNGPNGAYPAPVFDVTGISPGIELDLYRIDSGDSVLVNSLSTANVPPTQTTVSIADINFGPNHSPGPPIPDGTYTYEAKEMYLTGQVSTSPSIQVTILATAPAALLAPVLDPASDSGAAGDDITDITDPTFDVDSVAPNSTVTLFRDGVFINSVTSTAGGTVSINDAGPVPLGGHSYQTDQTDVPGNVSSLSPGTAVTIVSEMTNLLPPVPAAPVLDPASDTGDLGDHETEVTTPIFDISLVVPGDTVKFLRGDETVGSVVAVGSSVTIQDLAPFIHQERRVSTPESTFIQPNRSTPPAMLGQCLRRRSSSSIRARQSRSCSTPLPIRGSWGMTRLSTASPTVSGVAKSGAAVTAAQRRKPTGSRSTAKHLPPARLGPTQ